MWPDVHKKFAVRNISRLRYIRVLHILLDVEKKIILNLLKKFLTFLILYCIMNYVYNIRIIIFRH